MKWFNFLLVILCLGLVCGVVFFVLTDKPKILSEETSTLLKCVDTNDYDISLKGLTTFYLTEDGGRESGSAEDVCYYYTPTDKDFKVDSDVGVLREGYCVGNVYHEVFTTCGRGLVCRGELVLKRIKVLRYVLIVMVEKI